MRNREYCEEEIRTIVFHKFGSQEISGPKTHIKPFIWKKYIQKKLLPNQFI